MTTKADLEQRIVILEEVLKMEKERKSINISDCAIDARKGNDVQLAIAEAVRSGMEALQGIDVGEGDSYGIYIGDNGTNKPD